MKLSTALLFISAASAANAAKIRGTTNDHKLDSGDPAAAAATDLFTTEAGATAGTDLLSQGANIASHSHAHGMRVLKKNPFDPHRVRKHHEKDEEDELPDTTADIPQVTAAGKDDTSSSSNDNKEDKDKKEDTARESVNILVTETCEAFKSSLVDEFVPTSFVAVATSLSLDVITEDEAVEILIRVLAEDTSEESILAESECTVDDVREYLESEDLAIATANVRNLGGTVQRDDGQDMAEGRRLAIQFGGNNSLVGAFFFVFFTFLEEGPKFILDWVILLIPLFTERVVRIMIGLFLGDPDALNRTSSPSTTITLSPSTQPSTSSLPTFWSTSEASQPTFWPSYESTTNECPSSTVGENSICCFNSDCAGGLFCLDAQFNFVDVGLPDGTCKEV